MQKILEIMKKSLLAKICMQIFILNFFCMETFGMFAASVLQGSYSEDRRIYISNRPDIDISFDFTKDDFWLSYVDEDLQESFSKKDGIFDGEKYVFNLGENLCFSVDEIERKIFCHRLFANSSVSFSVGSGSLLMYELLCNGSVNLQASNIGVLGLVTASQGVTFNASNSLENFGTIDSPRIMMRSEQTKNFGKVLGKNVTVNSTFIELYEDSLIGASENLYQKSEEINADKASILAKQMVIESEKFELDSSVLNVIDKFMFQGSAFRLKDQSTGKVGSEAKINAEVFTNYSSRFEAGDLRFSVDGFGNVNGEIFSWKDAYIKSEKNIKNTNGKIEARRTVGLFGEKLINAGDSLIEGGFVKIKADNAINLESIIRSILGDIDANLKMDGDEFIPNEYARSNAKSISLKIPEDEFKVKRFSERQSKYPNPNEVEDESKNQEEEKEKESEKDDNNEIGSFLNYSGEIISAGNLTIKGSGGFYNVVDSIIESRGNTKLSFYGKVLNKSRSKIKSQKDVDMLAKIGIIHFENSKLEALNNKLESSDFGIDEFSEIAGRGTLTSISEKFLNRGNIDVENDIDLKYEQFDNSGKISSNRNVSIKVLKDHDEISFENKDGVISSVDKVTLESINASIGGTIKTGEFLFKLSNPKELMLYSFLSSGSLECRNAIYDYGIGDLLIEDDVILKNPTTFLSRGFYNEAVIKALSKLKIKSNIVENGYEHNLLDKIQQFNGYNLKDSEYDFQENNEVSVNSKDIIYIRREKLESRVAILGEDELEFEAGDYLYNSGIIEANKKIILNGKKFQTGWASWEQRALQLPFVDGIQYKYNVHDGVFDFPYDFYKPQKSIIRSYGDMEINCEKFISSFGNVKVDKKLKATVDGLFLNYAGNLVLGKSSHIKAKEFINSIGTMATNEKGYRYWKIATATTDPAVLLCNGDLKIDVDFYFKNKASYLSAVGDIYLNGKRANDILNGFDSRFVNESMGTEYSRMYTISGVDVSRTTKRAIGIKYGSSKTVTYWWQDINETIRDAVLRGAISSAQRIMMQGFDCAINTGVMDAQSIEASNIGDLGFSHGNKERLRFSAQLSESKKVTVEGVINKSDLLSDYLFENPVTDEVRIPFVIIDDGTVSLEDLVKAKPAMTIPEYAQVMYRELLKNYSTSRLVDMPTFEAGAQLAENNTQSQGTIIDLPYFSKAATKMFMIKPEDVKEGLYFRPYKYTDKYYGQVTLFPELYLSDDSLPSVLRDSYGAMHSEGDTRIDTSGNFEASASMSSGGRTEIRAKNVNFETKTYDKHTVTHQHFASASGGSILGSKTTGTKTRWERLITSREPVIISTEKGLGICLQEGGTAEFKGVIGNIKEGYEVKNGNVKLTPLMVNEVSVNENGSYVIPEYLKTVLAVDGDIYLDIDIFENTGSEIQSTGKMKIKANELIQKVCAQRYKENESYGASQSFFSSRTRHEKCYATKFSIPVMTAEEIEIETTRDINLEGLVTTEKDLKMIGEGDISLASRVFYQSLYYEESLSGIITNAEMERYLSKPQIAPNVVRAGGDYIVETLGNYYQTGVHSKILGNKIVHAKNITINPLKVEQKDQMESEVVSLALGLPSTVLGAAFSGKFSDAGEKLLQRHPLYGAVKDLFGEVSQARRASALVNFGIGVHNTVNTISNAMKKTGGKFVTGTAEELAARFFGYGEFGVSYTHTRQSSILRYGIPSIDNIGGDLNYKAEEVAEFIGYQAKAQNTEVIAGKKIIVKPSIEEHENETSQRTVNSGLNIVTTDYSLGMSGMDQRQVSQKYYPTSFESAGVNRFKASQISMTNPLLKAKKNEFIGETEFVTLYDVNKGRGSSFSFGISGTVGRAPLANVGGGEGRYYIESVPEMGVYGDIDIEGFLGNNSVSVYGVITGNYSYTYRPPRYERDSWGINLTGLNLSSPEAFGKSFMNAARSALLGYGAGKLAQKLGAGDFASSLIGSLASAWTSEMDKGLTSQGHISETHNDQELEIELVGFSKEQFNAEMAQIKQTIFDEAVDEGVPQAVAEQISEEKIKAIEKDLAVFVKKAKKVKELIEKTRTTEAKGKNVVEEHTRSDVDDTVMDLLTNYSLDEAMSSDMPYTKLFFEVLQEQGNLTPKEEILAFVPKNEKERQLKEKTLLRYSAEDLIEKWPMAKSLFIGVMYGVQAFEYAEAAAVDASAGVAMGGSMAGHVGAVVGGVAGATAGVAKKYAAQELAAATMDVVVEKTSSMMVDDMDVSPTVKAEFKNTVEAFEYAVIGFATMEGSKKFIGKLAKSKNEMFRKAFTKVELEELLAGKANDNVFLVNNNGIYMSKGKVINGERVGVGGGAEIFSVEPTGRYGVTRTNSCLRKGENPTKRPEFKQTKIEKSKNVFAEEIGVYKKVGGHHPLQKAAFRDHPNYSATDALAVSEKWLSKFGNGRDIHTAITNSQRVLQKELANSGRPNTMKEQVRIAVQSMIKAGIPENEARNITARAFWDLRTQNVRQPTNIPWNKKK